MRDGGPDAAHRDEVPGAALERTAWLKGSEWRGGYWFVVARDFCRLEFVRAGAKRAPGAAKGVWDQLHSVSLDCLGRRPVQITLTYPSDWRRYCPDIGSLREHRKLFGERWFNRWRERLQGMWKIEFQQRGAPHVHMYVKLPDRVAEEDYELMRRRTVESERLAELYGDRGGGERERAVEGEFGLWGRTAWAEVVGTQVKGRWNSVEGRRHHAKGFDVRTRWWFDRDPTDLDRLRALRYLAPEVGKRYQEEAPEGFGRVAQQSGWFRTGFKREVEVVRVTRAEAEVLDAMLRQLVAEGVPVEWGGGKGLGWDSKALSSHWGWGIPRYGIKAEAAWKVFRRAQVVAALLEERPEGARGPGAKPPAATYDKNGASEAPFEFPVWDG